MKEASVPTRVRTLDYAAFVYGILPKIFGVEESIYLQLLFEDLKGNTEKTDNKDLFFR